MKIVNKPKRVLRSIRSIQFIQFRNEILLILKQKDEKLIGRSHPHKNTTERVQRVAPILNWIYTGPTRIIERKILKCTILPKMCHIPLDYYGLFYRTSDMGDFYETMSFCDMELPIPNIFEFNLFSLESLI